LIPTAIAVGKSRAARWTEKCLRRQVIMSERRIYLVRHGEAEDVSHTGRDRDRALTSDGRSRTRRAARGLARLDAVPTLLASSPLVRARETADEIAASFPRARREVWDELSPGVDESALTDRLERLAAADDVMLVGHEPDFGELLAYWLTGSRSGFRTRFRKGAIACLRAGMLPPQGRATLEWMLTTKQLCAAAEGKDS
jgi:phosphohistidine phosphatase